MPIKTKNRERWDSLIVLQSQSCAAAHPGDAKIGRDNPNENIVGFSKTTYGCTGNVPELVNLNVFRSSHVTSNQTFARFRFSSDPDASAEQGNWAEITRYVGGDIFEYADSTTAALITKRSFASSGQAAMVLGADALRRWRAAKKSKGG